MRHFIFAYKPGSASAKALSKALGWPVIRHTNSRYRPRATDIVLNWGASQLPRDIFPWDETFPRTVINIPHAVSTASHKLATFRELDGTGLLPDYTTDRNVAVGWAREGLTTVCRTILQGHSGAGIVIAKTEDELVDAPLYVRYMKKAEEFRIHVMENEVIDVQRKARRRDAVEVNWAVRNLANGFIYQRNDVELPDGLTEIALEVSRRLSLNFGAVDLIWNNRNRKGYALEVNTAPGLTGTTLDNYVAALQRNYP